MAPQTVAIRPAVPEDFNTITEFARRAFIHDPVFNYFGSVQAPLDPNVESAGSRNLRTFFTFMLRTCVASGGRIMIAAKMIEEAEKPGDVHEKIVAAAFWLPPKKRLALYKVYDLFKCGIIKVLRGWKFTALKRIGFEYSDLAHGTAKRGFKQRGAKGSPDDTWYLLLVMVDPDFQGQGIMPSLVREAFDHAAEGVAFTLEATTEKSKRQYERLGFEVLAPIKLGVGKVSPIGCPAEGDGATGVDIWSMVHWSPKNEKESATHGS